MARPGDRKGQQWQVFPCNIDRKLLYKMSKSTCCVVDCKNVGSKSGYHFYRFPATKHKILQRTQWIAAVRRKNPDGSPWCPRPLDRICSAHFVGNKKSEEIASPSYIPTIFPSVYKANVRNRDADMQRHERFMKRRIVKQEQIMTTCFDKPVEQPALEYDHTSINSSQSGEDTTGKQTCEQGCQVDISSLDHIHQETTFVCNRYVTSGAACSDVEIQTDITISSGLTTVLNRKQFKNKQCGTPQKTFQDASVGPDTNINELATANSFSGIQSIKNDEQLLDLAGVTLNNFQFLLQRLHNVAENCKVTKENRLFMFLVKMKTGLTFAAIGVFFSIHRTTVSRIFHSTLEILSAATANFVFWPSKAAVQGTMPDCFKPDYIDTRVIIDCTELRIEVPASVDNRVYTYSHYKKGFTAKLLVGITPGGFISFKSKVAGGRKSDSQMTIESGLIDLLEDGDIVLADKGFPEIRRILDETGKKVVLVMPPFLERKTEFTEADTENTYKIAKVRIHVERIMQRLRTYRIISKIPANLFDCIDDVIHMCCVLVNLQPPIIANKNTDENK